MLFPGKDKIGGDFGFGIINANDIFSVWCESRYDFGCK